MVDKLTAGNFEAVDERGDSDNFHTSIYERDYDGLLIARCNQNGNYSHQVKAILDGLNGKQSSAELIAALIEERDRLRAALDKLEKAASEVQRFGASTGPQWVRLTPALIGARAILATAIRESGRET